MKKRLDYPLPLIDASLGIMKSEYVSRAINQNEGHALAILRIREKTQTCPSTRRAGNLSCELFVPSPFHYSHISVLHPTSHLPPHLTVLVQRLHSGGSEGHILFFSKVSVVFLMVWKQVSTVFSVEHNTQHYNTSAFSTPHNTGISQAYAIFRKLLKDLF